MPISHLDEFRVHYRESGNGKAIVILHGLGNNSQSWKHQLNGLEDQYRIIAWDAPGYGESSDPKEEFQQFSQFADVLKEFLCSLGLQSVYLLGHSMGSAIAIDFTVRFPEMVDALIISDATRGAAGLSQDENKSKLENRLHSINTLEPNELAKKRVKALLSPNASPEVIEEAERIMSQVRPSGYRSVSYSLANLNQMELLSSIQVPTLVLCGELDQVTPVSESKIFHEKISNSEFAIVPNTGHLCYQEDPETFNKLVIDFLQKQTVGQR
ncbi:alpha/beta fold hydrolase [Peribacillus alkalitolerans]|uniref:alpha/beta fold hydrolase n=1 Tax=Peribacillus alkalitolerans TaxID=1550385 RepID=UPI0013D4E715|nr:alpha/beta hydrolase [Peribacillus alkalitolerans]